MDEAGLETRRQRGAQDRLRRSSRARAFQEALTRALCGLTLFVAACTKAEVDDRPELRKIVAEDVRASKAMHSADDAVAKGDATRALALIESDAKPAIEDGLRLAGSAAIKTDWGKAKRDAIANVLRDRKNELPRYTEAVKSNDAEKMLSAIEAQAAIERRALAVAAGIE